MTTALNTQPTNSHPTAVWDQSTVSPAQAEHVLFEIKRLIVGQDHLLERLLVALLARGHVLLD
jgi:MoxR-like ATPase